MSGSDLPVKVAVAVDPFLLRTALHRTLAADKRFNAYQCPPGKDPLACAADVGAQMLMVSKPLHSSRLCVVVVSPLDRAIHITSRGNRRRLAYADMAGLLDQVAEQAVRLSCTDAAS